VAVDINSGRSTQERGIEEPAVKTNLEACEELARQIRLRDLAGLIVVDFIDMEDFRNIRKVEGAMRKALRRDRARIQFGRISEFGLMEISRQRLRPAFSESHLIACPHCLGSGQVHSPASSGLMLLRRLEDDECREADRVFVSTSPDLIVWLLNHKRDAIRDLESKYKYQIQFKGDPTLVAPDHKLELVNIKADGTESTQMIDGTVREQPEIPPELRQYPTRGRGGAQNKDKDKERTSNKNEKSSEEPSGRSRRNHKDKDKDTNKSAPQKAEHAGKPEKVTKKPDAKPEAKKAPVKASPAPKPKPEAKDEPLAIAKITADTSRPTQPAQKPERKSMKITAEPDTDAQDTPLAVVKHSVSEGKAPAKKPAATKAKKVEKTPEKAEKAEDVAKPGSLLSRLLTKKA
ncbi:MAG: hypothetical protein COY40_03375, partial [Alphaproteobacteria bacterium CG_4_10_14_0_8_um_filter_53_9]